MFEAEGLYVHRASKIETEDGKKLYSKKGIEVGNIFQLGLHYSTRMKNATFTDEKGTPQPYYMGCYGFGLARTITTVVESHHDDRGIVWPKSLAPYDVHLISIKANEKAEEVYRQLISAGVDVLYDDREDVTPGVKFADADLIGNPVRLVVSVKTGEKIEWKLRTEKESLLLSYQEVLNKLQK